MHDVQDVGEGVRGTSWSTGTLCGLVRASAIRHAERPALWVDGAAISYRELMGQAASLAQVAGNCIFLNTEMANGRTGCALFHHAQRVGVEPRDTRPRVCHSVPAAAFTMADDTETLSGGYRMLVTLQPPWIPPSSSRTAAPTWNFE